MAQGPGNGQPTPRRIWTVEAANARVPELAEMLPGLRSRVERLREVHEEIHRLAEFWGDEIDSADLPDREHKDRLDEEWRRLTRRVEEAVRSLRDDGIEIKDIDRGLLDFYGRVGSELVFLCWQPGEERVGFYHSLTGGYRSRRPLPGTVRAPAERAGPG